MQQPKILHAKDYATEISSEKNPDLEQILDSIGALEDTHQKGSLAASKKTLAIIMVLVRKLGAQERLINKIVNSLNRVDFT